MTYEQQREILRQAERARVAYLRQTFDRILRAIAASVSPKRSAKAA